MRNRFLAAAIIVALFIVFEKSASVQRLAMRAVGIAFPERRAAEESMRSLALLAKIADLEKEKKPSPSITAKVIFGGGFLFSDTLVANKGSEDGVTIGDYATAYDIVIGRVENTTARQSTIIPFSRFGEKVVIRLGAEKDIVLEGEGIGAGEIRIELPKDARVVPGDSVWWGEQNDYLVGLVNAIDTKEGRALAYAYIRNPFSLHALADIIIIRREL